MVFWQALDGLGRPTVCSTSKFTSGFFLIARQFLLCLRHCLLIGTRWIKALDPDHKPYGTLLEPQDVPIT
jgi:hypothetical protein